MDIVERLRRYRPTYGWPEESSVIVEPTMNHVAADEIERLRKDNKGLRDALEKFCNSYEPHLHPERCQYCSEAYWAAREALKGKSDDKND
jgi:CHAD domain-containing protein